MNQRHRKTLKLVKLIIPKGSKIFDLGASNRMANYMRSESFDVRSNTPEKNFDIDQSEISNLSAVSQYTTSFEVFEHLLNTYAVLKAIKS